MYICIVFAALGLSTGAARIYSRLFITKALGLDDLLVVLAIGFITALMILVIIGNRSFYSGRHIWDVPPTSFVGSRINIWASLWCYVIGHNLIKISVLLFYRRLSVKFSKTFLVATWIGIAYNILYFFGFGLSLMLICRPLHSYWDSFNPKWAATHHFHCGTESIALPASSAFSVFGDLYSTLLPLILVYNLKLPHRQKLALYGLFALGFMAVTAGIIRTVLLYRLLNIDYDFSRQLWLTWILGVLEIYLALFAASAPSLKPFFRHLFVDPINSIARSSKKRLISGKTVTQDSEAGTGPGMREGTDSGIGMAMTEASKGSRISNTTQPSKPSKRTSAIRWPSEKEKEKEKEKERSDSQQSWFLGDQQEVGTKHFELHNNQAGKGMIPMRVYRESADGDTAPPQTTPQDIPSITDQQPVSSPHSHYFDASAEHIRSEDGSDDSSSDITAFPPPPRPPSGEWPLPGTALTSDEPHQPHEWLSQPHISSWYSSQ